MNNKSRVIKGIWIFNEIHTFLAIQMAFLHRFCRRLWRFAWHCAASFAHYFWHPALGDTKLAASKGPNRIKLWIPYNAKSQHLLFFWVVGGEHINKFLLFHVFCSFQSSRTPPFFGLGGIFPFFLRKNNFRRSNRNFQRFWHTSGLWWCFNISSFGA